ncbi:putative AC9 transposase [Ditylenchus destructor]|uniref:AC9 transposase n=1 Tax=Ditylenchus destructor TaxID=166010 RepID=A0AAD4QUI8_9BILA|nr:putative AC9 transposase [Ditylenchus destructor]
MCKPLATFFEIFREPLTVLQAENTPTIHLVWRYFKKIEMELDSLCGSDDAILQSLGASAMLALNKKTTKYTSEWAMIATILDPQSKKMSRFSVQDKLQAKALILEKLRAVSSEYPAISSLNSPPAKRVQRFDFVDFNDDMAEPEPTDGVEDELQKYLESPGSKEEISQYWKSNSYNFPTMAKLAINVLGIPASSSSPERYFSALKLLVTDNRYNLSGSLISKIMIAKSL